MRSSSGTGATSEAARGALRLFCVLAAALLFAGCASTPPPTLLTIPAALPAAAPAETAADASARPVLALQRVEVPEYLVSRRVRYRADDSTLAEWPHTYWAERIEAAISHEFAGLLRAGLRGWRLCEDNCAEQGPAAALRVEVLRMDFVRGQGRLEGYARFGLWSAEAVPRLLAAQEKRYEIAAEGDSAQAQARAMAQMLRRMADDAAAAVAALPR